MLLNVFDLVVLVVTISVVVFVVTVSVCVVVFVVTKSVVGTSVVTRSVVVTLSVPSPQCASRGRWRWTLADEAEDASALEIVPRALLHDGFDVIAMQFCDFPEQCYLLR